MPTTYVLAFVSALAASILFRIEEWTHRDLERGWLLVIRVVLFLTMLIAGFEASELFGTYDSRRAKLIAVAVLMLPPFLASVMFGYRSEQQGEGKTEDNWLFGFGWGLAYWTMMEPRTRQLGLPA